MSCARRSGRCIPKWISAPFERMSPSCWRSSLHSGWCCPETRIQERESVQRSLLRKLAGLSRTEWVDLLQAQAALIWAQLLVWTRPTGKLIDSSATETAAPSDASASPATLNPRAYQLALAIGRAAEY